MTGKHLAEQLYRWTKPSRAIVLIGVFTFLIEMALVDRKYAIFTGGFGQSKTIDTPLDWLCWLGGAVAMHGLLFWSIYRLLSWIHARREKGLLLRFNIICLAGAGFLAALIGKFEILSYFSDAISFSLIKSLGGGSVKEAVLYGIYYGGSIAVVAAVAIAAYAGSLFLLARRDPKSLTRPQARWSWKKLAVSVAGLAALLLAVNVDSDARYGNQHFLAHGLVNLAFDKATDFDRDSYSYFTAQMDDHPFDSRRHPFALDVPNNGEDEDGVGGDLVLKDALPAISVPPLGPKPPHVIHVVFESMRGDVLGKRINGKPVAPNLEALAARGSVRKAFSPVGFTAESIKSMFSGHTEPPIGSSSLFTDLKESGYSVGVFSGQAEHFGDISDALSSSQVADVFIDAEKLKEKRAYGHASLASVKLDEMVLLSEFGRTFGKAENWTKPNFLYFNFQSAHFPYWHPGMANLFEPNPIPRDEINPANQKWLERTYWNAIAYADLALGQLVATLKAQGVYDDTIIIVTGDHGEALYEGGFIGHGHMLNTQQYQTVMVLSKPGYSGDQPIGLVDYRRFILAAVAGLPAPERKEPILLNIGPLQTPGAIAMVDAQGHFTILHLDSREVQFGEQAPRQKLAAVTGGQLSKVNQLIALWGRERWHHKRLHDQKLAGIRPR